MIMITISVFIFLPFCHTDPDFPTPVVDVFIPFTEVSDFAGGGGGALLSPLQSGDASPVPRAGAEKEAKLLFAQGKEDG